MAADFALGWLPDTRALWGADGAVRGVGPVGGQIRDMVSTVATFNTRDVIHGPVRPVLKLLVISLILEYLNRDIIYVAVSRCFSASEQFTQTSYTLKVEVKEFPLRTYWTDPLLGFLPSLASRFFGERMSKPTGKFRACLLTWLLLSSEIILVSNSRERNKPVRTAGMWRNGHSSPLASSDSENLPGGEHFHSQLPKTIPENHQTSELIFQSDLYP